MAPHRQFHVRSRPDRGFFLVTLIKRLFWLCILTWAGVQLLIHKEQVMPWVLAASTQVQKWIPKPGASSQADKITQGYSYLRSDTVVGLYRAVHVFAEAAQASEHDVQARAGQADAEVALAHAYGMSSDLLTQRSKALKGAPRRAGERLAKEESREARKHSQRALQLAKEALRLSPVAFTAQRAMAGALLEGGRTERAKPYLAQAKAACPADPATLIMAADQTAEAAPQEAVALLHQVLAQEPHYNAAHLRLALLFRRLDMRRGARQELLAVLEANPEHDLAQSMLLQWEPMATRARADGFGHVLPREREVQRILLLEEASNPSAPEPAATPPPPSSSLSPNAQRVLLWSGRTAMKSATWLKQEVFLVLAATQRALEKTVAESQQGKAQPHQVAPAQRPEINDGATPSGASGVPLAPSNPNVSKRALPTPKAAAQKAVASLDYEGAVATAKSLQQAQDNAGAEAAWRQALTWHPDSVEANLGLGWCRLQAQDGLGAEPVFRSVLRFAPRNTEAWFGLAEALRLQTKSMDAQAAYRQYLSIEPAGALAPLCHRMLEALSQ